MTEEPSFPDTNYTAAKPQLFGKCRYLAYPDFEKDPHPSLLRAVKLNLRSRELDCYDYSDSANPPMLHRKETFLTPDHALHEKFAKLTRQEQKAWTAGRFVDNRHKAWLGTATGFDWCHDSRTSTLLRQILCRIVSSIYRPER